MADQLPVSVEVTEITVCALPLDHPDADAFAIFVARWGGDRWSVRRLTRYLSADGSWSAPAPGSAEWRATHLFTKQAALDLAVAAAPDVTYNRHRARDAAARLVQESGR